MKVVGPVSVALANEDALGDGAEVGDEIGPPSREGSRMQAHLQHGGVKKRKLTRSTRSLPKEYIIQD